MGSTISKSGTRPVESQSVLARIGRAVANAFARPDPNTQSECDLREKIRDLRARGRTAEAIAASQELLARTPDDASVAKTLGDLLAPRDKERAAAAYIGAAFFHQQQGFLAQAKALLTLALSLDPARGDAWKQRADINVSLGHVREALGDFAEAARLADAALSAAEAAGIRAYADEIRRRTADDLIAAARVKAAGPPGAQNDTYEFRLQMYAEARRILRTVVAIDPDRPDGHRLLGDMLVALGEIRPALAAYERAEACYRSLNLTAEAAEVAEITERVRSFFPHAQCA